MYRTLFPRNRFCCCYFKLPVAFLKTTLLCILYIHTQFSSVFVSIAGTSELVMLSLDLVKTRLAVMSMEMRKNFIQAILTSLIEKSTDAKILRAVVKIVEEWVKNNSPMAANQVNWEDKTMTMLKYWINTSYCYNSSGIYSEDCKDLL